MFRYKNVTTNIPHYNSTIEPAIIHINHVTNHNLPLPLCPSSIFALSIIASCLLVGTLKPSISPAASVSFFFWIREEDLLDCEVLVVVFPCALDSSGGWVELVCFFLSFLPAPGAPGGGGA